MKIIIISGGVILLLLVMACNTGVYTAGSGEYTTILSEPIWLSGIAVEGKEYNVEYPKANENQFIKIASGGFWLTNNPQNNSTPQLVYSFDLNFKKKFDKRVYTKAILTNPKNPSQPFVYEHYLDTKDSSTSIHHSPVSGVELGAEYELVFEIYHDIQQSNLITRIVQKIRSPVDNTGQCIFLNDEYKEEIYGKLRDPFGRKVPIDKIVFICGR